MRPRVVGVGDAVDIPVRGSPDMPRFVLGAARPPFRRQVPGGFDDADAGVVEMRFQPIGGCEGTRFRHGSISRRVVNAEL